ncbi:hypothetical protein ACTMTU_34640 [Streptomyces sp. OZ13]|uniref:hypothetical protein n=1 Tax=Streptomyces sp. OZ13 TaxID=3452210 RepID=UPI003F8B7915
MPRTLWDAAWHRRGIRWPLALGQSEGPRAASSRPLARRILDEVAEAHDRADHANRDAASTSTVIRNFALPCTSHCRKASRQLRNARGLDRLRVQTTIG